MITKTLPALLFAVAAFAGAPAAQAASFNFLDDSAPGKCVEVAAGAGVYGNTRACEEQASMGTDYNDLRVTAYANTGSGGKFAAAYLAEYEDGGTTDADYYGYGVKNSVEGYSVGSPNHAMDNKDNLELMLLKFDSSISLTTLQAGWAGTDSDVSVFAYTGIGNAVSELTGATESSLMTTAGWSHIGNYANIGTGAVSINSSAISSSYWIVSAYSTAFGSGYSATSYDYVKIKIVAGNYTCVNSNDPSCAPPPTGVPEPVSLALVGVALFGAWGGRNRARRA